MQLFGMLLSEPRQLGHLAESVKQKILMSLDLLAGAIAYGVTYLQDNFDESTRRCFLLTGGRSFVSPERTRRARARADANRTVNAGATEEKEHAF